MKKHLILIVVIGLAQIAAAQCPTTYVVMGGGNICNSNGVTVTLSLSQVLVNYQLQVNGSNVGAVVPGTGSSISWSNLTLSGSYTVVGTNVNSGCTVTMNGSAIASNTTPQMYTLTGSGNLCAGGATVTLNGSQVGISYTLYRNSGSLNSISGTGNAISWTNQTIAGTYTVQAAQSGCMLQMSGSVAIGTPTVYTVSGGGTVCTTGATITLSSSQTGVNYQLMINGSATGTVVVGTGSGLSWANQATAGSYTVIASMPNGCTKTMTGSAAVTVNTPQIFTLAGSGNLCTNGATITLGGSQSGASYTLFRGTTSVQTISGTGSALNWTNQTAGTYTVKSTVSSCTLLMTGSIVTGSPATYAVSGGGSVCSTGVSINLSSSQTGINYQLNINGTATGSPIAGIGSGLSWSNLTVGGTYTVTGISQNGCTIAMNGSGVITVTTPQIFAVAGSGNLCAGTSVNITLGGSQSGYSYTLIRNSSTVSTIAGTGNPLTWTNQNSQGNYTVKAQSSGGCTLIMSGTASVGSPNLYNVSGGGTFCNASATISLSSSDISVNYQLQLNGSNTGAPITGTGSSISWIMATSGTYTITAINSSGCSTTMSGSAAVTIKTPQPFVVTGNGNLCGQSPGATITLSGSNTGTNYSLYISTGLIQTLPGTGNVLSWSGQLGAGNYTVQATLSGCTATMAGSVELDSPPHSYAVTGGGILCVGSQIDIGLSSSATGVNYQLQINGLNIGAAIPGTQTTSLTWPNQTLGGTYTVLAISPVGCTNLMNGSATVTQTIFTVGGGGNLCSGNIANTGGVPVTLNGSAPNYRYQLNLNGAAVGMSQNGNGQPLSWPNQTTAGTYTVVSNSTGGQGGQHCTETMTGSATIIVGTSPTKFVIGGGGFYCNGSGLNITLSGSQNGINYQLLNNHTAVGAQLGGTASSLTWQNNSSSGTYTILAADPSSGCSTLADSTTVTTSPAIYSVQGGGAYCSGGSGVAVSLNSSQAGVNYQLKINNNASGPVVVGTGGTISWLNQTTAGAYAAFAMQPADNTCSANMNGSVLTTINPLPPPYTVGGGGAYCPGTGGKSVTLNGSQSGVIYKLLLNGTDIKNNLAGNGSLLTWPNQSPPGNYNVYTVTAINTTTECISPMNSSASISLSAVPAIFTASGGAVLATSSQSTTLNLSGSELGVNYQLKQNGNSTGAQVSGTGASINWSGINSEGEYTVTATNTTSGCSNIMSGTPDVLIAISNNTSILTNYAFQYQFDKRRRMISKKVPGSDWVYMVYDQHDRLVMTQDGNQRISNQWTVTKYDSLNRPVLTALYTHSSSLSQANMTKQIDSLHFCEYYAGSSGSANYGYSLRTWPKTNLTVLTVSYYDNYNFVSDLFGSSYNYLPTEIPIDNTNNIPAQLASSNTFVSGYPTGGQTAVMGTSTYLKSAVYYDPKYRVVQSINDNNKGGFDRVTNVLDFVGRVLKTKTTHHTLTHSDQIVARRYVFDHASRPKQVFHTVNSQPEILIQQNSYNELGQLVDKSLHSADGGNTFKQSEDFRYNIRGWLQSLNNSQLKNDGITNDDDTDLFGVELAYNAPFTTGVSTGNALQYNGNISAMKWSLNAAQGSNKDAAYNYMYDPMNRITGANYLVNTANVWGNFFGQFSESNYTYDQNGNVLSLTRNGVNGAAMDLLQYNYGTGDSRSNRLMSVSDGGDKTNGFIDGANTSSDYGYDPNGNMTLDNNKQIDSIRYNYLNLPVRVKKHTGEFIKYTYSASGKKLKQQIYSVAGAQTKATDYDGEFIYQNDTLQFINHEEGRIVMMGVTTPEYQYHLKDHLGNVRVTFTSSPATDVNTATYETANANVEQSKFVRYTNARRINATIFDHTNGNSPGYSERLSGGTNEIYGLARSISVMPGDLISAEVYAKYVDPNTGNLTTALNSLMGQIAANTAGVVVDGTAYATSTSSFPAAYGSLQTKNDNGAPRAYLNWLIFDRNFVFITGGFKQITTVGKEAGTDVPHEYVATPSPITITQPGYVYIYLSNENPTPVEVYFDDFKVTQKKSPVVQMEDFYPFGLSFNSATRENTVPQNYLYNGKEQINDLGLDWADYGARMYMPEIGRWGQNDPLSDLMRAQSPYNYTFNNPVRFIDPDGMKPGDPFKSVKAAAKDFGKTYNDNSIKINMEFGSTIYKFQRDGKTYYSYSAPEPGGAAGGGNSEEPEGTEAVATIHTHGAYVEGYRNNDFSDKDKVNAEKNGLDKYVATPNGSLLRYNVKTNKTRRISRNMPSDSNDPDRLNRIDAADGPKDEKLDFRRLFKWKDEPEQRLDDNNKKIIRPPKFDAGPADRRNKNEEKTIL